MRVLHLFDWYLPSTLSWVSRLLLHLRHTEVEIAAPWIVYNHFFPAGLRAWQFPVAPPADWEGQYPLWQRLLTRSQRFVPSYPFWLERQLRSAPPDLLHAHFGPTGCLYLPLARKLDRPLVVTFYGFDYKKLLTDRPVFRKKYRRLFAEATRVVSASPTGRAALEALGCPPEKLALVRPSPDLAQFPFKERVKLPGTLTLIQAATFTPKKGHLVALEAFRQALVDCPGLELRLVGEAHDKHCYRQVLEFIRAHRLGALVRVLPPVDHRQMAGLLSGFDAFIHPSCHDAAGDHEATPVVTLEAQAVGLPVLATRHFDLPDQVQHGRSGWLVEENDAAGLAQAIRQLYTMPSADFSNMRRAARRCVEENFTVEHSAEALENIYRELV